jgi:glycosyltransferase involved in cell wall biosynthesis
MSARRSRIRLGGRLRPHRACGGARTPAPLSVRPVRLVQVIARLNIGGPSIHVLTLTKRLEPFGYQATLVRGQEGRREGNMDHLARELGVEPVRIPSLQREPGWHDLRALVALIRIMRSERPHVVHTHAAKGGTLGRLAALVGRLWGTAPVLVHTYHGHSLAGYFAPRTEAVYRSVERVLARRTDALIAVSEEVRDELVALGIGPPERFVVIPIGLDLSPFCVDGDARLRARLALREELGIAPGAIVVTLVARLAPIKRVDRFLRSAGTLLDIDELHFLIVGDGELHDALQASPEAQTLADRVTWAGFRHDMPQICFASDVVVLCSDNEGTPVSLIEAGAAGLPTVSTQVGGVGKVVLDGDSGILVERDSDRALSEAIRSLVGDRVLRDRMGSAGRAHVLATFSLDRTLSDTDALYRRLLAGEPPAR